MSIDMKMAWRNIWRNARRSVLTISAVAFASLLLVFMLSFQLGSYDAMINTSVKIHTGHIQIQAKGYNEKQDMRLVVSDPEAIGKMLEKIPQVEAYTFRANGFSLLSSKDRTYGGLVIGIDPKRESELSRLKTLIREGRYLAEDDTDQALVGKLLAKNLHIGLGDEVVVLGQGQDGSIAATVYKVKGIYETGQDEFDRASIQVPLQNFQEVYSMRGSVHEVVVTSRSLKAVPEIKQAISARIAQVNTKYPLVALSWDQLTPGLKQGIQMDLYSGYIMYGLLILVVAFSILNTFLMAVFERTKEFGMLLAIGTTPKRLSKLLLMESAIITLIGIFFGLVIGSGITLYFQSHGLLLSGGTSELMSQFGIPDRIYPELSLLSASFGPVVVLGITMLTALYPALKVWRLQPVEAMMAV
jgi:putative ABC transport system permease protein